MTVRLILLFLSPALSSAVNSDGSIDRSRRQLDFGDDGGGGDGKDWQVFRNGGFNEQISQNSRRKFPPKDLEKPRFSQILTRNFPESGVDGEDHRRQPRHDDEPLRPGPPYQDHILIQNYLDNELTDIDKQIVNGKFVSADQKSTNSRNKNPPVENAKEVKDSTRHRGNSSTNMEDPSSSRDPFRFNKRGKDRMKGMFEKAKDIINKNFNMKKFPKEGTNLSHNTYGYQTMSMNEVDVGFHFPRINSDKMSSDRVDVLQYSEEDVLDFPVARSTLEQYEDLNFPGEDWRLYQISNDGKITSRFEIDESSAAKFSPKDPTGPIKQYQWLDIDTQQNSRQPETTVLPKLTTTRRPYTSTTTRGSRRKRTTTQYPMLRSPVKIPLGSFVEKEQKKSALESREKFDQQSSTRSSSSHQYEKQNKLPPQSKTFKRDSDFFVHQSDQPVQHSLNQAAHQPSSNPTHQNHHPIHTGTGLSPPSHDNPFLKLPHHKQHNHHDSPHQQHHTEPSLLHDHHDDLLLNSLPKQHQHNNLHHVDHHPNALPNHHPKSIHHAGTLPQHHSAHSADFPKQPHHHDVHQPKLSFQNKNNLFDQHKHGQTLKHLSPIKDYSLPQHAHDYHPIRPVSGQPENLVFGKPFHVLGQFKRIPNVNSDDHSSIHHTTSKPTVFAGLVTPVSFGHGTKDLFHLSTFPIYNQENSYHPQPVTYKPKFQKPLTSPPSVNHHHHHHFVHHTEQSEKSKYVDIDILKDVPKNLLPPHNNIHKPDGSFVLPPQTFLDQPFIEKDVGEKTKGLNNVNEVYFEMPVQKPVDPQHKPLTSYDPPFYNVPVYHPIQTTTKPPVQSGNRPLALDVFAVAEGIRAKPPKQPNTNLHDESPVKEELVISKKPLIVKELPNRPPKIYKPELDYRSPYHSGRELLPPHPSVRPTFIPTLIPLLPPSTHDPPQTQTPSDSPTTATLGELREDVHQHNVNNGVHQGEITTSRPIYHYNLITPSEGTTLPPHQVSSLSPAILSIPTPAPHLPTITPHPPPVSSPFLNYLPTPSPLPSHKPPPTAPYTPYPSTTPPPAQIPAVHDTSYTLPVPFYEESFPDYVPIPDYIDIDPKFNPYNHYPPYQAGSVDFSNYVDINGVEFDNRSRSIPSVRYLPDPVLLPLDKFDRDHLSDVYKRESLLILDEPLTLGGPHLPIAKNLPIRHDGEPLPRKDTPTHQIDPFSADFRATTASPATDDYTIAQPLGQAALRTTVQTRMSGRSQQAANSHTAQESTPAPQVFETLSELHEQEEERIYLNRMQKEAGGLEKERKGEGGEEAPTSYQFISYPSKSFKSAVWHRKKKALNRSRKKKRNMEKIDRKIVSSALKRRKEEIDKHREQWRNNIVEDDEDDSKVETTTNPSNKVVLKNTNGHGPYIFPFQ